MNGAPVSQRELINWSVLIAAQAVREVRFWESNNRSTGRVVLIADWNTGKNRFGYSAAGVGVTLTKKSYLYSAYYFGNEGRGNNSLGVYYGYSF